MAPKGFGATSIGAEALGDDKGFPRYATDGERDQAHVEQR
jgi:hypothetical protein